MSVLKSNTSAAPESFNWEDFLSKLVQIKCNCDCQAMICKLNYFQLMPASLMNIFKAKISPLCLISTRVTPKPLPYIGWRKNLINVYWEVFLRQLRNGNSDPRVPAVWSKQPLQNVYDRLLAETARHFCDTKCSYRK